MDEVLIMSITDFLELELWNNEYIRLSVMGLIHVTLYLLGARVLMGLASRALLRSKAAKRLDMGRTRAVLQITKYVVYTIVILMALDRLDVPVNTLLTASAALFVGLGLGLQDTFKDLSSGVILLVEGTLDEGDIIMVDQQFGRVENVGLRTTAVRTIEDIVIIVPNSKLTNEKVVNWSHSQELTRFKIAVQVHFGADTALVNKLLLEIANAHALVEKKNKPTVLFQDFGENGLKFELAFYTVDLFKIEKIKSELRFSIDQAFRANNIAIPYPQRTVWLNKKD